MTSLTAAIRRAHVEPANPIYPVTYGGRPPCFHCFRQRAIAWTTPPDGSPGLILSCSECSANATAGRPIDLPTGEELAQVWQILARLHNNGEIGDSVIDRALILCTPKDLRHEEGWEALETLKGAMLRLQGAEDPSTVLDRELTGPDHDAEAYVNFWRGIADAMLTKLTGEAR